MQCSVFLLSLYLYHVITLDYSPRQSKRDVLSVFTKQWPRYPLQQSVSSYLVLMSQVLCRFLCTSDSRSSTFVQVFNDVEQCCLTSVVHLLVRTFVLSLRWILSYCVRNLHWRQMEIHVKLKVLV